MERMEEMADHYKLMGDKSRLTILAALRERELCVCDIVDLLGISQPNASQHLRKLKAGGLVNETRRGQWVYYSLNVSGKPHIEAALEQAPSQKEKLDRLKNNNC